MYVGQIRHFVIYRHVSENSQIYNLEDYYIRRMAAFPSVIAHNIFASAMTHTGDQVLPPTSW
jgi:hypothetical protein